MPYTRPVWTDGEYRKIRVAAAHAGLPIVQWVQQVVLAAAESAVVHPPQRLRPQDTLHAMDQELLDKLPEEQGQ
jgi:hypothetical protein